MQMFHFVPRSYVEKLTIRLLCPGNVGWSLVPVGTTKIIKHNTPSIPKVGLSLIFDHYFIKYRDLGVILFTLLQVLTTYGKSHHIR